MCRGATAVHGCEVDPWGQVRLSLLRPLSRRSLHIQGFVEPLSQQLTLVKPNQARCASKSGMGGFTPLK